MIRPVALLPGPELAPSFVAGTVTVPLHGSPGGDCVASLTLTAAEAESLGKRLLDAARRLRAAKGWDGT